MHDVGLGGVRDHTAVGDDVIVFQTPIPTWGFSLVSSPTCSISSGRVDFCVGGRMFPSVYAGVRDWSSSVSKSSVLYG